MRIFFNALSRPKRAAKALADACHSPLNQAQELVAAMCGYRDWHELRAVTESGSQPPSPDDEDVEAAVTDARRAYQASVLIQKLGVSQVQAERVVAAVSPSSRSRSTPADGRPLLGRNVYTPRPGTYFDPDVKTVCCLLMDVKSFAIEFWDPSESHGDHLASKVEIVFEKGMKLELPGVYLWKFLDTVPPELADAHGDYLQDNPYTFGTLQGTMRRLQAVYAACFSSSDIDKYLSGPPQRAEFDFDRSTLRLTAHAGISRETWSRLDPIFRTAAQGMSESLLPLLRDLAAVALDGGYMDFGYRKEGKYLRPSYTAARWNAPESVPLTEVLKAFSKEPLHPDGCGGQKLFSGLLRSNLEPYLPQFAYDFCRLLKEQGELPALAKELNTYESSMTGIAHALLGTKEKAHLAFALLRAVTTAHEGTSLKDLASMRAKPAPRPKRVVDETKRLMPVRGGVKLQSLRLEDPRTFPLRPSQPHDPLLDSASFSGYGFFDYNPGLVDHLSAMIERRNYQALQEALLRCEDCEQYAALEGAIAYCLDTKGGRNESRHQQSLLALEVFLHSTDPSGAVLQLDTQLTVRDIQDALEESGAMRSATSWAVAPYFASAEGIASLDWDARRELGSSLLANSLNVPLPAQEFPKTLGCEPIGCLLLIAVRAQDLDALLEFNEEAIGDALESEVRAKLGITADKLRVIVLPPQPVLSALRGHGDLLRAGKLWTFLEQAYVRHEFRIGAEPDRTQGEDHVGLKFVAGDESISWALPRSRA